MESSEREKLMGMFCRGNVENKKPAAEDRTGKHCPLERGSTGTLATCSRTGYRELGRPSRGSKTRGLAIPRPVIISEVGWSKKSPGRSREVQVPVLTRPEGCTANSLHGPVAIRGQQPCISNVDGPIPGGRSHSGHQEEESQTRGCSTTTTKRHIYI